MYRLRLCGRISSRIDTEDKCLTVSLWGREVTIRSDRDGLLSETDWIVFEVRGFPDKESANEFGYHLRTVVEIAGLCSSFAVDTGNDTRRSYINEKPMRDRMGLPSDFRFGSDIHGLYVYPDDDKTVFVTLGAAVGVVSTNPNLFLAPIEELSSQLLSGLDDDRILSAVRCLTLASMHRESLSRVLLSFAAIEPFGQDQKWSSEEKQYLEMLVQTCADDERVEIADAIRRLHRTGLIQGVRRFLKSIGLASLDKEWRQLYNRRSRLIHGDGGLTDEEISKFANRALQFVTRVVLTAIKQKGVHLPRASKINHGV